MILRLIAFKNKNEKKYIQWLEKIGLAETMFIMVNSLDWPINEITKSTVLYLPIRESIWWKK